MNDKRHTWSQWRYGHSDLAVDGKLDTNLPNCAIMDNYYVNKPLWRVDLGAEVTVNGAVILTWQGAGQGIHCASDLYSSREVAIHFFRQLLTRRLF